MADERACVRCRVVGNGYRLILSNDADIEVDQAVSRNISTAGSQGVCRVADGARKSVLRNVVSVLRPAGGRENDTQVVALATHAVGALRAQIRIGEGVGHGTARNGRLAHGVVSLEDVRIDGAVWARGPSATKFAIVVAVVAIRAKNACAYQLHGLGSIFGGHVGEETRLRQRAVAIVGHGMTRSRGGAELRDQIEWVAHENQARGQISIFQRQNLLASTGAVAAETGFVLIDGWRNHGYTVHSTHTNGVGLRGAHGRWHRKGRQWIRGMRVVAIHTRSMAIVVHDRGLGFVVQVYSGGQQMWSRF